MADCPTDVDRTMSDQPTCGTTSPRHAKDSPPSTCGPFGKTASNSIANSATMVWGVEAQIYREWEISVWPALAKPHAGA
jgi:hypothetical protein